MNKRVVRLVLFAAVLALPASGVAQVDRPEGLVEDFIRAWNAHDMKALGELFAEDADFVNVGGKWWKGRAEIQARHEEAHATRFKTTMLVETNTTVRLPRPDVAVLHFKWELSGQLDREGKPTAPRHGIMQIVAVRQAGVWRIVSAQNTNAMTPV